MDEGVAPLPPGGTEVSERHGAVRRLVELADNGVSLHVDAANEEYYLDLTPDHYPSTRTKALALAAGMGLELMSVDECEPDVLEDGTTRHYLAEVIPA